MNGSHPMGPIPWVPSPGEDKLTAPRSDAGLTIVTRHFNIQTGVRYMAHTLGEYRVGIDFNPSGDDTVSKIKTAAAVLIDFIDNIEDRADGEVKRLKSLAQTHIEDGAMWGVKAATKKPRE